MCHSARRRGPISSAPYVTTRPVRYQQHRTPQSKKQRAVLSIHHLYNNSFTNNRLATFLRRHRFRKPAGLAIKRWTISILHSPASISGAPQKVKPKFLQARILHISNLPVLSSHTRQRHMYDTLGNDCNWPHMTNDVQELPENCA